MKTSLICFLCICVVLFLVLVFRPLMHQKISVKQGLRWFGVVAVMAIALAFPGLSSTISNFLGFEITSNMIFIVGFFALLFMTYFMSVELTQQKKSIALLSQELSILKAKDEKK